MRYGMGMGAATAALLLCASAGSADPIVWNLTQSFSSDQPDGYVQVKLETVGGNVKLTLTSFLEGSEFLGGGEQSGFYLNFDDALDVEKLSIVGGSASGSGGFTGPTFDFEKNGHKADGDGLYDMRIYFANGGGSFDGDEWYSATLTYDLGGTSISASHFNFLSKPDGGHGPFVAAAHVQGTDGPEGSGWVTVPLPAPVFVGLAGLALAACVSVIKRHH